MEVVAKDVKLQMEFNPAQVAQYRLIGYENRKLRREDFDNDKIDAGEIGAGHRVTALYEVVLTNTDAARKLGQALRYQTAAPTPVFTPDPSFANEIGFLKVRFKKPNSDASELTSFPLLASSVKRNTAEASPDFRFAAAVSYFAHILRGSRYAGAYSLQDVASLAQQNLGDDANGYRREFVELVKNAAAARR
jgi:Ca-activated chloride channel family protein